MNGTEQWHAIIYFRDGHRQECAYSNDERATERTGQMIFDQAMKTATNSFFEPTRMVVVKDHD